MNQAFKGCVVVQGPANREAITEIKRCFDGYQLVFSCWVDDDSTIYEKDDIVVLNQKPEDSGPQNFYLQRKSTIEGMKRAKELGWTRALKWRSDMWCTDGDRLFRKFDSDSLNLYFWLALLDGYIADFFMEGEIDDIITLFDTDIPKWKWNYPEFGITLQFFKNGLERKARFMGKELDSECDIFWLRTKGWFSKHKEDNWYRDSLPENWKDWIPMRRGQPINLFE